jgi:hypothetical protein
MRPASTSPVDTSGSGFMRIVVPSVPLLSTPISRHIKLADQLSLRLSRNRIKALTVYLSRIISVMGRRPTLLFRGLIRRTIVALFAATFTISVSAQEFLAGSGTPAIALSKTRSPVADIVSPIWHDEKERDNAGEPTQLVRLLGIKSGMTVADFGAGSGYYVVRLSPIVGSHGRIIAEDVVPEYLQGLRSRVRDLGLRNVVISLGEPHDPRLPADSLDIAILVHMYHEIAQPYRAGRRRGPWSRARRYSPCPMPERRQYRMPKHERAWRFSFLRKSSGGDQIDLHLAEFQRSARPCSPFGLTITGEIATPVICSLGILVCSL